VGRHTVQYVGNSSLDISANLHLEPLLTIICFGFALRVLFKPTEIKDSDVFQLFATGSEIDHAKLASSPTELKKHLESVSGMPTEAFGEIVTLSEYKLVALYIRNWLC
jgi:hypothetical protein